MNPQRSSPDRRLTELGLALPPVPDPVACYVPAVRHGGLVFVSGQVPMVSGSLAATGKVGAEVSAARARDLARQCALNAIAAAAGQVGGLDGIERIVKLVGYVASAPDFTGQSQVIDGASTLLADVFGDAGVHARAALGVSVLPLDAPVEVELTVAAR